MIEKKSKNVILWKYEHGFSLCLYSSEYFRGGQLRKRGGEIELKPGEEQKLRDIKFELTDLEREERLLDTHLRWIKQVF